MPLIGPSWAYRAGTIELMPVVARLPGENDAMDAIKKGVSLNDTPSQCVVAAVNRPMKEAGAGVSTGGVFLPVAER